MQDLFFFLSDLHLATERPEKIRLLGEFLEKADGKARAIYILGDIFEQFWIGTDDSAEPNPAIISLLAKYGKKSGAQLFVLRGNRDFYLNHEFARQTGCTLLPDPTIIEINNEKILIMHGDKLCTLDRSYQRYRKIVTLPITEKLFMSLPVTLRKLIVRNVRSRTKKLTRRKPEKIIDAHHDTVLQMMRKYQVQTLIHGHTHRQGVHTFKINGEPAKRIVLGDWYEQDSVLMYTADGFAMLRISQCIAKL